MDNFDSYVFILCLAVFLLLTGLSIFVIRMLLKLKLKLIRSGVEDQEIKTEYELNQKKNKRIASRIFDKAVAWFFILIFLALFAFSIFSSISTKVKIDNVPSFYVVKSSSMSKKHPKNKYLVENNLNNQFSTFDLILTYNVPKEEELKLYDVVVYEVDDVLLIHRIVAIEEANEKHPAERWFLCQGDNVETPDRFPVKYNQIRAIYKNQHLPFVGSFVSFMQSPAGWLCVILVIGANIATPILEKKLQKEKELRLALCVEQEAAVSVQPPQEKESLFDKFNKRKVFKEKLALMDAEKLGWYEQLVYVLNQLPNIRVVDAKYHQSYRMGNKPVAKVATKGKSLYVYLAVDASKYQGVQYGFKDVSGIKAHGQFTAECKITSARKLKNVKKLLAGYGENIVLDMPKQTAKIEQVEIKHSFSFDGFGERKTFKQKLALLDAEKLDWYEQLVYVLNQLPNIRVIDAKYHQAYRMGNKPVAKVAIKGKSLYVYLAVDASKYQGVQYGFKDVSGIKAHGQFTAESKVTSVRKLKNIKKLLAGYGENVRLDMPVKSFDQFKKKKSLSFKQKLSRLSPERKERLKDIIKILEEKVELTKRESKSGITFKRGRKPIAKLTVKGKSVYAYLAVDPKEYVLAKYGIKDVANVKAHKDYPAECKLTSQRKTRLTKQIIEKIIAEAISVNR